MKANEAPEKIYLNWVNYPLEEMQVEYVRTDAFIEKACEYIRNHIDQQLTIYHEQTWKKRDEFIEDFRKYMEEE